MKDNNHNTLANNASISKAIEALASHNIKAHIMDSQSKAKELALSLIPEGRQVMTATSTTLDQMGLSEYLNESGKHDSIKEKLRKMNREADNLEMQKLGAAPEYVIGSVHAVTEDGKVVIASGSGSQLPAYSYGASHVIWIVSTKKIVKDLDSAFERIYSHVLPLEDQRMKKVYGPESGSSPRKVLIINAESNPDRISLIFVKENLGF